MANNYMSFSETIPGITADEKRWIEAYLAEEPPTSKKALCAWMAERGIEDKYDLESWPCFVWSIDSGAELWLRSEESFNPDHVAAFVQRFLAKWRPYETFKMTYADYCDKLRVGEFGGGWVAVSAYGIEYGNAYCAVEAAVKKLAPRVELEKQSAIEGATHANQRCEEVAEG